MNLFEFGQALKEARIAQRLTQSELASRTGVSLSSISGLERGSLSEIGTVKLLQLFAAVGLELQPRVPGQRKTIDDIKTENIQAQFTLRFGSTIGEEPTRVRKRVRHAQKKLVT
jgi:transcriptional regulator with XRE-family HTH domain